MVVGEELGATEREIVAEYWWSRAAGEMTSWVGWRHVLADLRTERSPDPILALAERAVADEHRHALFCRDWAERFGHEGGEIRPRGVSPMELPGRSDAENRLARIALCCFTETVGCFTLKSAREWISNAALRKQNQQHLSDELQHARAGWAHLSTLDGRRRDVLVALLPELFPLVRRVCCDGEEAASAELVPFGYFTPELLREAHDAALAEVILPGLRHLGIEEAA